jgi:hypothetical protein
MDVSFSKLTPQQKEGVVENLEIRRRRFEHLVLKKGKFSKEFPQPRVTIVGDRPGPSAPIDPSYHHTPFYSTSHCSGWLNSLLFLEGIDENILSWVNAYDRNGNPTDISIVDDLANTYEPSIIALGANAEKWLVKNGYAGYLRVDHPQYHKRFKNKQYYPLIRGIMDITSPVPCSWTPYFP